MQVFLDNFPRSGASGTLLGGIFWGTTAVDASEDMRGHKTHGENAKAQTDGIGDVIKAEISDLEDEKVADDQIEKAPKHVDGGGGQTAAGRFGKRTLKRSSHQATDQMWNRIGKKCAAKEIRKVMKILHNRVPFSTIEPERSQIIPKDGNALT